MTMTLLSDRTSRMVQGYLANISSDAGAVNRPDRGGKGIYQKENDMNKDRKEAIQGSLMAVAYLAAFVAFLWAMLP